MRCTPGGNRGISSHGSTPARFLTSALTSQTQRRRDVLLDCREAAPRLRLDCRRALSSAASFAGSVIGLATTRCNGAMVKGTALVDMLHSSLKST